MEKTIIEIIDKKAAKRCSKLTPTKRKAYRAMLYAGAQVTLNGYSIRDVAVEIDYSESGTSKLVQRWIKLMGEGDVTVNLIIAAIRKIPKKKRFKSAKTETIRAKEPTTAKEAVKTTGDGPNSQSTSRLAPTTDTGKRKGKYVLGFFITPEDEMCARAAISASIRFFRTYGKGMAPRTHGEYYAPGCCPKDDGEDARKWLPLDTAAVYCGCKADLIKTAAQNGEIERRVYKRKSNRNYYEYNIDDLDMFIRNNDLL